MEIPKVPTLGKPSAVGAGVVGLLWLVPGTEKPSHPDFWDMMSPTLDGGFFVCGQGRSERGGNQARELVIKRLKLLSLSGSSDRRAAAIKSSFPFKSFFESA